MDSILFIGSLKQKKKDGSGGGGTYYACQTMSNYLRKSGIVVIELNTTYKSNGIGDRISLSQKILTIVFRNLKFITAILYHRKAKSIVIFVGAGNSFFERIPIIVLSKLTKKKVILFPRSGGIIRYERSKFYQKIISYALRKSDYIVCQSSFWYNYYSKYSNTPDKFLIVENWYPIEQLELSKSLKSPTWRKDEIFRIVFVARLEKSKGVNDLIALGRELKAMNMNFIIHLYGEGTYKNKLQYKINLFNLQENLVLKGWLGNVNKLATINKYHLAVFTSRLEGYPNTLLDYIFAKIPILSTDLNEIKVVGKENIQYYSPGDILSMTERVLKVKDNYMQALECSQRIHSYMLIRNHIDYAMQRIINLIKR